MLHPDSQFEILRSFQEERLREAAQARELKAAGNTTNRLGIGDRFLLVSGELLIAFGTKMKCRVSAQYCDQRPVEARHGLP